MTITAQVRRTKGGEPACRPGSVRPPGGGPAAIHLGLPLPAASCGLPAGIGRAALDRSRRHAPPGACPFDLAPGGVYRAAAVTCGAGGLLHHRFTLTPRQRAGRSVFCGTFPRVTPGRRYRPPCPVEPGPSSPGLRDPARPPGRLTLHQRIAPQPAAPLPSVAMRCPTPGQGAAVARTRGGGGHRRGAGPRHSDTEPGRGARVANGAGGLAGGAAAGRGPGGAAAGRGRGGAAAGRGRGRRRSRARPPSRGWWP